MYHSSLIHSFIDGHLGCYQHLAIVNCAAMNIGLHRFFWTDVSGFLGYNPSSRTAGSNGSSIFTYLSKFYTVFYSDCTSLHYHWQHTSIGDHSVWFRRLQPHESRLWKGLVSLPGKPGKNAGGGHEPTLTLRVPMGIRPEMYILSFEACFAWHSPVDINWMFKFKA